MPLVGWIANRFGRRRLFLSALVLFTVGSLLGAQAGSFNELLVYRVLQGLAGAFILPLSQAVMLDLFPPARHGFAMSLWGMATTMGPILGPPIGGYLTENFSWRWNFYVNLPFAACALFILVPLMRESRGRLQRPFDLRGYLMLAVAIGCLQMVLDRGERADWFASPLVIVETAVAAGAFYMFIVHSMSARDPFIPPLLLRDANFLASLVFITVVGFLQFTQVVLMPTFAQVMLGVPVDTTGLVVAPRGAGILVSMLTAGQLVGRIDHRLLMLFGIALISIGGVITMGFMPDMGLGPLLWASFFQGFGMGFLFVPLSAMAFSRLPPEYRNDASAFFNLMRGMGGTLGVAILVTLLGRASQLHRAALVEHLSPYRELMRDLPLPAGWAIDNLDALARLNGMVGRQALMLAYLNDFVVMTVVPVAVLPLLLLLRRPNRQPASRPAGKP